MCRILQNFGVHANDRKNAFSRYLTRTNYSHSVVYSIREDSISKQSSIRDGGIIKLLRRPEIDSKESIPPAYIAWRAGMITVFLLGSQPPKIILNFQHCLLLN
jgi:hypothetical protein